MEEAQGEDPAPTEAHSSAPKKAPRRCWSRQKHTQIHTCDQPHMHAKIGSPPRED